MAKSKLPLEQRIFVARRMPTVIIVGDGEPIAGPFCVNCGNPSSFHRDHDDACPVRRLHPLMPKGAREECNCTPRRNIHGTWVHDTECATIRYGFNGTPVV
jgi:hypothetical protein